ncbi:MAG TPA: hypothetical protein VJQ84_07855 [Solirubrobacterales bacterium]|nr:hypothetical protein [Solirubrobacterales bacterium]
MTPRFYRMSFFVFAGLWAAFGVWALAQGDYVQGGVNLALSIGWLLVALFRDKIAPRSEALLERQRARVKGFGALSFQPDPDRPKDQ